MGGHDRRRWIDGLALLVVLAYAGLAWSAQSRSQFGGVVLDRVWAQVQARGVLRVAVDVGFRPFADDHDGALVGYDIDLAQAVAAQLGVTIEFVPTGFDALYDALTSGRADMIASALPYAPERGDRARFSSFYFDAGQMLVAPAEAAISGPGDLAGRRVGVTLGSDADTVARRLAAADPRIVLRSDYDEPDEALADLRRGQLDAVVVDHIAALTAIQRDPGLRIVAALTFEPFALAVPAEAFLLHTEVNRALERLRVEGLFEELNRRWFR